MNLEKILGLLVIATLGVSLLSLPVFLFLDSPTDDGHIEKVHAEIGDYYIIDKNRDPENGGIFYVVIDNETGVQYLFMDYGYGGGFTPRYNADGTLYIDKSIEYDAEED